MSSTKIDIITNAQNLVEFKGPHHRTAAELDRKSGEWGVWCDGRKICTRPGREAAIDEAARLCSKD